VILRSAQSKSSCDFLPEKEIQKGTSRAPVGAVYGFATVIRKFFGSYDMIFLRNTRGSISKWLFPESDFVYFRRYPEFPFDQLGSFESRKVELSLAAADVGD
jgi:hypothetical protein